MANTTVTFRCGHTEIWSLHSASHALKVHDQAKQEPCTECKRKGIRGRDLPQLVLVAEARGKVSL